MLGDDAADNYVRIDSTTTRTCPSGLTYARNIPPKEFLTPCLTGGRPGHSHRLPALLEEVGAPQHPHRGRREPEVKTPLMIPTGLANVQNFH